MVKPNYYVVDVAINAVNPQIMVMIMLTMMMMMMVMQTSVSD